MNDDLLRVYLNDHLAGSVEAVEMIEHILTTSSEQAFNASLRQILVDIKQDQAVLRDLHARVGGRESRVKDAVAWLVDKVSRLKLNEFFKHRDLSRLEELEGLMLGVRGKLALWTSLEAVSRSGDRFNDVDFQTLKQRARQQHDRLEAHHIDAARKAFAASDAGAAVSE